MANWQMLKTSEAWPILQQSILEMEKEVVRKLRNPKLSSEELRYWQGYLSALQYVAEAPERENGLHRLEIENHNNRGL
jgi:hypothetical protein